MSTQVFISYRRADRQWAEQLGQCLATRGISYWYDGMLGAGQDWRDEIVENIKLANVLIILFSDTVNRSTELKKELSVADQSQTIILVVRIENVMPKEGYAYELSDRNWFDAFDNPHKQLDEVADLVAKALANPGDLKIKFAKSAEELKRRRRRQLFGYQGLLRNTTFLALAFVLCSAAQFFVYDSTQSAVSNLVKGGTDPMLAILAVAFAASIGSPLLLLEAFRQQLQGLELLLVPFALLNVTIIVLLIRSFVSWICERLSERQA